MPRPLFRWLNIWPPAFLFLSWPCKHAAAIIVRQSEASSART